MFVDDPVASASNPPETSRRRLVAAKLSQQSKTATASVKRKSVKSDDIFHRSLRGACYFGFNFVVYFLEVCAGSAVLTQAMRMDVLMTLDPIDEVDGWDLTLDRDVAKLEDLITKWRLLHTHFAPNCSILHIYRCFSFSIARP